MRVFQWPWCPQQSKMWSIPMTHRRFLGEGLEECGEDFNALLETGMELLKDQ